jgi:hypothetical protein
MKGCKGYQSAGHYQSRLTIVINPDQRAVVITQSTVGESGRKKKIKSAAEKRANAEDRASEKRIYIKNESGINMRIRQR